MRFSFTKPTIRNIKLLLVIVLALFLAACGSRQTGSQAVELVVLVPPSNGEIIDKTVTQVMKDEYNVNVVWQEANSSETFAKILQEKGAPEISVACPAGLDFLRGIEANLWAPMDLSRLSNAAHIYELAKSEPFSSHGVVITVGGAVLQYHTGVFEENGWDPPTAWADLADPKFKGHVGLISTANSTGLSLLSLWSRQADAGRGDVEPGFAFAKSLMDAGQVTYFPTRGAETNAAMERGEIWISTTWSEGGLQFAADGGPVDVVYPSEGTFVIPNICAVVAGSPNQEAATHFIDELLSEATQTAFARERWSSPVRSGLDLPPEYEGKLLLTEEEMNNVVFLDDFELAEFKADWHTRWTREIEGATN